MCVCVKHRKKEREIGQREGVNIEKRKENGIRYRNIEMGRMEKGKSKEIKVRGVRRLRKRGRDERTKENERR